MKTNIPKKPANSKVKNPIKSVKRGAPKSKKAPKVVEGEKAISITEKTILAPNIEEAVKAAAKENIKSIEETKKDNTTVSETKADNIKSDTKSYDFTSNTTYLDVSYSNVVVPQHKDNTVLFIGLGLAFVLFLWTMFA